MALYVLNVWDLRATKPTTFYFDVEEEYQHAVAVAKERFDVITHYEDHITDADEFERWVKEQG